MNSALLSSKDMGWETPESFLHLVRQVAGGPIGLDPCTTGANPTDASVFIAPPGDGLRDRWSAAGGLVYVNPPYGREIGAWVEKMAREGKLGAEIIGLVPARVDTKWWQKHAVRAQVVCFWSGRIKFRGASAGAPFPCAVLYWGNRTTDFRGTFGRYGWIPL